MKSKLDKKSKLAPGKSSSPGSDKSGKSIAQKKPLATKSAPNTSANGKTKSSEKSQGLNSKPGSKSPVEKKSPEKKIDSRNSSASTESAKVSKDGKGKPAPSAQKQPPVKRTAEKKGKPTENFSHPVEPALEDFSISLIGPGDVKERVWRMKSFQQIPAQREFGFPEVAPELPTQYGEPKLVLMPKDPEYMFCYWELTPFLISLKEQEKQPTGNYRETLKINWDSKSLFEPNFTFIPVFFWAKKWYFGVPQVGQRYQVELGWLADSGHFISILSSNLSELPESWATTQKRIAEQGEVLAHTARNTKIIGSSDQVAVADTRNFLPEWNLSSESMTSSSWSRGPSQATHLEPAANGKSGKGQKAPAAKAKLEISGKVQRGTRVSVSGISLPLDPAGNFRVEFPYDRDILTMELTSSAGAVRTLTYDLKELVLT